VKNPSFYVSILDLALLPVEGLDKLARLSFQTLEDGAVYNVLVAGAKFLQDNTLTIYFASMSMSMLITDTTATLSYSDEMGNIYHATVYIPPQNRARRLELIQRDGSGSLAARCSSGLCYHTLDEILDLQGLLVADSASDEVGINGQARLLQVTGYSGAPSTPTFAEITADGEALSNAKVSGVEQAQTFINGVLEGIDQSPNQTIVLKFFMLEKCSNHPLLKATCAQHVCDSSKTGSSTSPKFPSTANFTNGQNRSADNTPPFTGMVCDSGAWYFHDYIEYRRDAYVISVTIAYSKCF
jgi:hypothetical protein